MADIVDARAIAYCDEIVRPMASQMVELYWKAKYAISEHAVVGALFPADESPVKDASDPVSGPANGKKKLTGYLVGVEKDDLAAFVADMEANSGARLARYASIASHLSMFDEANVQ